MPRQTTDEIRAEIVDAAAALIARQGIANTSVQQIADAVGYSKQGLLHHFSSKAALHEAVIRAALAEIETLTAAIEPVPAGIERDRVAVGLSIDLTYRCPGLASYCVTLAEHEHEMDPRLIQAAASLSAAWGITADTSDTRMVQVITASSGLTAAATTAVRADRRREWRDVIVRVALNALGHADDALRDG
jgi:AcrR family transcriptional regulator